MQIKIVILVPYYNESKNLSFFIKEWENFLKSRISLNKNLLFLFIDDGSNDNSSQIIKNEVKKINYKIIKKSNSGHGDTCKFGYKFAVNNLKEYEYLLQIDSDNQCDPKYFLEINNLIKKKNYNFIFGYRINREDGYLRYLMSRIMSITVFLKKFLFIKDLNTPYRLMKMSELDKVLNIIQRTKKNNNIILFNCLLSYVIQKHDKIKWININFRNRYFGKSNYNFLKMLFMYFNFIFKL